MPKEMKNFKKPIAFPDHQTQRESPRYSKPYERQVYKSNRQNGAGQQRRQVCQQKVADPAVASKLAIAKYTQDFKSFAKFYETRMQILKNRLNESIPKIKDQELTITALTRACESFQERLAKIEDIARTLIKEKNEYLIKNANLEQRNKTNYRRNVLLEAKFDEHYNKLKRENAGLSAQNKEYLEEIAEIQKTFEKYKEAAIEERDKYIEESETRLETVEAEFKKNLDDQLNEQKQEYEKIMLTKDEAIKELETQNEQLIHDQEEKCRIIAEQNYKIREIERSLGKKVNHTAPVYPTIQVEPISNNNTVPPPIEFTSNYANQQHASVLHYVENRSSNAQDRDNTSMSASHAAPIHQAMAFEPISNNNNNNNNNMASVLNDLSSNLHASTANRIHQNISNYANQQNAGNFNASVLNYVMRRHSNGQDYDEISSNAGHQQNPSELLTSDNEGSIWVPGTRLQRLLHERVRSPSADLFTETSEIEQRRASHSMYP